VVRGEKTYREKGCASCHGDRGEGNVGPALRPAAAGQPKEIIVQQMWNHAPQMGEKMGTYGVPWPHVEADEMAHLFAFLAGGWKAEPVKADAPAASSKERKGNP
jgi:mono/diheme cytochrome c family protein